MLTSRRQFLAQLGVVSLAMTGVHAFPDRSGFGLSTITWNILGCRGYPRNKYTEFVLDAASPQLHLAIADALAGTGADLITLCECPDETRVSAIAERLGFRYAYFPSGWPGDEEYPGGFPGAILSRYPIRDAVNCPVVGRRDADMFTRHFGKAILEPPAGAIAIFTVHLHPSEAAIRLREIDSVLQAVDAAETTPLGVLVQGDLNHVPESEEHARWTAAGLTDCFGAVGIGNGATYSSVRPRQRIDYIWARGVLASSKHEARVLNVAPFSTIAGDRASIALSDHLPVQMAFRLE